MTMRVSTRQFSLSTINAILDQQVKLNHTSQQMATGKRVLTPSDDPVAATRILTLGESINLTDQYKSNADYATNRLSVAESSLSSVTDILQRVRELTVQASNASVSDQDRNSIADEVQSRLDNIFGIANMKDANGEYMYSGGKGTTIPFAISGGNYIYQGNDTVRNLSIGPNFNIAQTDSGSDVFMRVPNGNGTFATGYGALNGGSGQIDQGSITNITLLTHHSYTIAFTAANTYQVTDVNTGAIVVPPTAYTSGSPINFDGIQVNIKGNPNAGDTFSVNPSSSQSIFATVQKLVNALRTPSTTGANSAKIKMTMQQSLVELDNDINHISDVRATIGGRLNTIDGQGNVNADLKLQLQTTKSSLEDLDYASAVSQQNLQMVGLQAAQATYTRAQGLSLFNYIH